MKKIIISLLHFFIMTQVIYGQQNMTFQTACHPEDVKHYDTQMLRKRFVMEQ